MNKVLSIWVLLLCLVATLRGQSVECKELTIDENLAELLANLAHARHSSEAYGIGGSAVTPVDMDGSCIKICAEYVWGSDMEFRLVWDGKFKDDAVDLYYYAVNNSFKADSLEEMGRLALAPRGQWVYFDLQQAFKKSSRRLKVKLHHYIHYYKEFDFMF